MTATTTDKRRSLAGVWPVALPPVPDGNIGDGDRRHLAGLYRFEDVDRIGRVVVMVVRPKYRADIEGSMLLVAENDVLIELIVTEEGTGDAVDDASLLLTIYDDAGDAVAGATSVALEPTGSDGVYRGTVPASAGISAGSAYRLVVSGSNYGIKIERWERAVTRAD